MSDGAASRSGGGPAGGSTTGLPAPAAAGAAVASSYSATTAAVSSGAGSRSVYGKLFLDPLFKHVFLRLEHMAAFLADILRTELSVKSVVEREEVDLPTADGADASAGCDVAPGLSIDYVQESSLRLNSSTRGVVFDAYCVLSDKREVVVEVQNVFHTNFCKRMWGYTSYAVAMQYRGTCMSGGAPSGKRSRGESATSASSTGTSSSLAGRGRMYDFRPVYGVGITNFIVRDEAGRMRKADRAVRDCATATQCLRMSFAEEWYTALDRRDENVEAMYKELTAHIIMQLPLAPPSDELRKLSASEAFARYARSDLWATMLRESHTWDPASHAHAVPAVFTGPPFAAPLEASRLVHFHGDDEFMAAYRSSEAIAAAADEYEIALAASTNEIRALKQLLHEAGVSEAQIEQRLQLLRKIPSAGGATASGARNDASTSSSAGLAALISSGSGFTAAAEALGASRASASTASDGHKAGRGSSTAPY